MNEKFNSKYSPIIENKGYWYLRRQETAQIAFYMNVIHSPSQEATPQGLLVNIVLTGLLPGAPNVPALSRLHLSRPESGLR